MTKAALGSISSGTMRLDDLIPAFGSMSDEDRIAVNLALGRLFKIMSRPYQDGDVKSYWKCVGVVTSLAPAESVPELCWARDRLKGAQGDD